ncbi:MAG: flagellar basal body-associated FliL family protein [Gammaproteobacteria bacterium]|nr:flagellar basal body-associated FliL family protein [Gammaproteobacteria bacterium]
MAKEEATEDAPKAKSTPWLMIIIIVLLSIVTMVGTIMGTLHFTGVLAPQKSTTDGNDEEVVEEEEIKLDQAIYLPLEPAFVVNFEGRGPARFLQITVEVMTRDPAMEEHIKKHMPVIRNNLVFLFGSQTYESVSTLEGKEKLRSGALAEVQKILEEEVGQAGVEALYFTSFVMQ